MSSDVADGEQRFAPPSRVASQNIDPVWAVEQTHRLCKQGEEDKFRGKCRILDKTKYNSIRSAVDLLNALKGTGEASAAFCIVFSKNREEYFLLYQRKHQKLAFTQFEVYEQWSVERAAVLCKKGEESRFRAHAQLVGKSLNFETIQDAVDVLNYPYDATESIVDIPDICVVWIHGTCEYYIVYHQGQEGGIRDLFGIKVQGKKEEVVKDVQTVKTMKTTKSQPMARTKSSFAEMTSRVNKMFCWLVSPSEVETPSSEPTQLFNPKAMACSFERSLCTKYDIVKQIGSGAQGTAHLVKKKNCPEEEAFFVAKETHDTTDSGIADFMKEFDRMRALRHPNCLTVFELFHCPMQHQLYIITEYAKGGDLYYHMNVMMQNEEVLSEDVVVQMMRQAMKGVAYLHAESFVHNDLKPDNLLVMDAYKKGAAPRVVVADYGCATLQTNHSEKVFYGDPRYMSPEAMKDMMNYFENGIKGEKSGPAVDVWAMGVTIYQFLGKGVIPFIYQKCTLQDLKGVFAQLRAALLDPAVIDFRSDPKDEACKDTGFSAAAQDLIRKLLEKDVRKRCTIAEVLDDPWFADPSANDLSASLGDSIRFHATRSGIRQILRNAVASKLRHKHVEHCFSIFSMFDPDNSGTISKEEFRKAWKKLGSGPEMADEYFDRADVDKNDSLEFNEFAAITLDWRTLDSEVLDQHLLDLFDILKEGAQRLNVDNFKELFKGVLGTIDESDMRACIAEIDEDGDGFITVEELKGFIRQADSSATSPDVSPTRGDRPRCSSIRFSVPTADELEDRHATQSTREAEARIAEVLHS